MNRLNEKRLRRIVNETIDSMIDNASTVSSILQKLKENAFFLELYIENATSSGWGGSVKNYFSSRFSQLDKLLGEIEDGYRKVTGREW